MSLLENHAKNHFKNQIVAITGASSGIGQATALAFAAEGAKLLLFARRTERLQEVEKAARAAGSPAVHCVTLDVRDRQAVEKGFAELPAIWKPIRVLVNNAGLAAGLDPIQTGNPNDWEQMIDTNLKGLLYVSKAVIPLMLAEKQGHLIQIGSIAGHETYPNGNVYCATKAAVHALNTGMAMDLINTPIRVTTIDPGKVETEFSLVRFKGDSARAKKVYEGHPPLQAQDIAETVLWVASRPAHVNIREMVILPSAQAAATVMKT